MIKSIALPIKRLFYQKELAGVFFAALALSACSLRPDMQLRLDRAPVDEDKASQKVETGFKAHVKGFSDRRKLPAIGDSNGSLMLPAEDPGQALDRLFTDKLRENGVALALFNSASFSGEVRDWYVSVRPAFPSTNVNSRASLLVKLSSPDGKVEAQGVFSGTASAQRPYFSKGDIEEVLGSAMSEAIQECLNDPSIRGVLSTYAIR